jgi:hypothetical protein
VADGRRRHDGKSQSGGEDNGRHQLWHAR